MKQLYMENFDEYTRKEITKRQLTTNFFHVTFFIYLIKSGWILFEIK